MSPIKRIMKPLINVVTVMVVIALYVSYGIVPMLLGMGLGYMRHIYKEY